MNNFFTADCHFGHANIIRFCNRPFLKKGDLDSNGNWVSKEIAIERCNEMNETLIANWNAKVRDIDHIYHIGDFSFCDPRPIMERLNGHKHILIGDHDKPIIKWRGILEKYYRCSDFTYMIRFPHGKQEISMIHWKQEVWPRSHFNSWHLYGHSHGHLQPTGKSWDAGVDNNNFSPLSFDEVVDIMKNRPDNFNLVKNKR